MSAFLTIVPMLGKSAVSRPPAEPRPASAVRAPAPAAGPSRASSSEGDWRRRLDAVTAKVSSLARSQRESAEMLSTMASAQADFTKEQKTVVMMQSELLQQQKAIISAQAGLANRVSALAESFARFEALVTAAITSPVTEGEADK